MSPPSKPLLPTLDDFLARVKASGSVTTRVKDWLEQACRYPKTVLLEAFVLPNLYRESEHYLYAPVDPARPGHPGYSPQVTRATLRGRDPMAAVSDITLITNPLAWDDANIPTQPSTRTKNVGQVIYTLEFDANGNPGVDLMDVACEWHMSGRIGKLHKQLCRFRDYRGYSIVYSGRSSPHLHFLFDIRHLSRRLAGERKSSYRHHAGVDVPDARLYEYYKHVWDRIAQLFHEVVDATVTPDRQLRTWVQPRRSPWGLRIVKDPHPWGLPVGMRVPQVVLAEDIRSRAREAEGWFHDAEEALIATPTTRDIPTSGVVTTRGLHDPMIARITDRLIEGDWPRYAGHEQIGSDTKLKFLVSPTDTSPDAYMLGRHTRIQLIGDHRQPTSPILPASANEITKAADAIRDHTVDGDHPLMRQWQNTVKRPEDARHFLRDHLVDAVLEEKLLWVRSPEGLGKTTTLLSPDAMTRIHERLSSSHVHLVTGDLIHNTVADVMVAFQSYDQAHEKVEAFNRSCEASNTPFEGFLLRSRSRLYADSLGVDDIAITLAEAMSAGFSAIWGLIRKRQPEVWSRMIAAREALFDVIRRGKRPVIFTVIDVAEAWRKDVNTRSFYAPSFSMNQTVTDEGEKARIHHRCKAETEIELLIVDEVGFRNLLDIEAEEKAERALEAYCYISSNGNVGNTSDIMEPIPRRTAFRLFRKWAKENPAKASHLTFEEYERILRSGHNWYVDIIEIDAGTERPFDIDNKLYDQCDGVKYYLKPKEWWNSFPKMTFLTTELLPTILARRVIPDLTVLDFTVEVSKSTVDLKLDKRCRRERISDLEAEIRESNPDVVVIGNMMADAISHMASRGLNSLENRDIFAIYTWPSLPQFAELAAINTKFGLRDAIRLTYVDTYNQTSGRNRGFRDQGRQHVAMMSSRLYRWLAPHLAGLGRYRLVRSNPAFGGTTT